MEIIDNGVLEAVAANADAQVQACDEPYHLHIHGVWHIVVVVLENFVRPLYSVFVHEPVREVVELADCDI